MYNELKKLIESIKDSNSLEKARPIIYEGLKQLSAREKEIISSKWRAKVSRFTTAKTFLRRS